MNKTTNEKLKQLIEKILILIYKYRFLNRLQIQTLLNHKHKTRINIWLNYLTTQKYLIKDYVKKFPEEPAVYSLGLKGKQYFQKQIEISEVNPDLLNRVYQERNYTKKFKKHCMFLADIYFALTKFANSNNIDISFHTKTELTGLDYLIEKEPDAFFSIKNEKGDSKSYFLEVVDKYIQWKELDRRIEEYVQYYENNLWQSYSEMPFPEIIIVSPDDDTSKHLQSFIKNKINEEYEDLLFYLSSWDEIKLKGFSRENLHKVN